MEKNELERLDDGINAIVENDLVKKSMIFHGACTIAAFIPHSNNIENHSIELATKIYEKIFNNK
jgi:hypothetical protein